jgi:hypothetical protein
MAFPPSAQKRIGTGGASNAEKQPTGRGPERCVETGAVVVWRLSDRLSIDRDICPPRNLPAAHFERNDVIILCERLH